MSRGAPLDFKTGFGGMYASGEAGTLTSGTAGALWAEAYGLAWARPEALRAETDEGRRLSYLSRFTARKCKAF